MTMIDGCMTEPVFNPKEPLFAAVDIGTTSVEACLTNREGRRLCGACIPNPQRRYGTDVIMRGQYALTGGARKLAKTIRTAVDGLLRELCGRVFVNPENIVKIVMVGNSCMHHLFLGLPVDTLVRAPYKPVSTETFTGRAADFGITSCGSAALVWLPLIGGFVGADSAAAVFFTGMHESEEIALLIDIGTNGEMVLGNREGMYACSAAAGPVFEGAGISCGMRAMPGAIDRVYLRNEKTVCHVIGEGRARGICGSGLIDAAACLLGLGVIEPSGRMRERYHLSDGVYLEQKDIRKLQTAKAAICAGVLTLFRKAGVGPRDIDKVYIAGAFGNQADDESIRATGLLPSGISAGFSYIGNAALKGAVKAAADTCGISDAKRAVSGIRHIELASDENFREMYVKEMAFPQCGANEDRQNE